MKILLHLFLVLLPVTACSQNAPMNTRQDYTQPYTRSSLIADVVADRGYATMAFDHSFVGSSEGHPRAYEDPEVKGSDWRSAITFAQTLSNIDAECIAGIGICGSGVYLPCGVKDDPRMKAVVSIVPFTIMDIVVTASDEQLLQIPVALAANGCKAASSRVLKAVNEALDTTATVRSQDDQVDLKSYWRRGVPNDAYAQYFTGRSYVSPYGESITNVTFEPGCRNNWHIHHGAVQVLVCVYGHGWYQEWGKPAVELREGVVIEVPEGVKHWHGAAKGSWMQHLTYHKNLLEETSNKWLEPVSDEVYNKVR